MSELSRLEAQRRLLRWPGFFSPEECQLLQMLMDRGHPLPPVMRAILALVDTSLRKLQDVPVAPEVHELIGQKLDWLGVNYYTRHIHAAAPGAPWPATREVPGPLAKTQMGWEIYPEGLEGFLTRLARDHVGDLPIYVTENGMAHADVPGVDDEARIRFVAQHFAAAQRAIAAGCNLRGFFYWSLLDNYEWAEGYEKRFGLVHVDFKTFARTPKASYHALKRALARN